MECPKCELETVHRSGVNKETGKPWGANFCSDRSCKGVIWDGGKRTPRPNYAPAKEAVKEPVKNVKDDCNAHAVGIVASLIKSGKFFDFNKDGELIAEDIWKWVVWFRERFRKYE